MKKRHIGYYTVMFVPEGNGRIFYIKVNKYLVRALILFLLVFFAGISFLVYKSAEIGTKIQLAYYLKAENERLREESAKLYAAVKKIDTMERTGDYLQRLADIINVQVASESPLDASGAIDIERKDSVDAAHETSRQLASALSAVPSGEEMQDITLFAASIPSNWPVEGWITQRFDPRSGSEHSGLDIAAREGTMIRATAPGIVSAVLSDQYLGTVVVVKHRYGFETRFGHCRESIVSPGEIVGRGQVIAFIGNTGRSTAPHVHYEIIKNGRNEDPASYIQGIH